MQKILILSHRDIRHLDGGGAPLYVHEIFKRLTHRYDITILSTAQHGLPSSETLDGVRIVRLPFRHLIRFAMPMSVAIRFAQRADILIDNGDVGFPWLTPLYSRKPILSIIYQVAREIFRYELDPIAATIATKAEPWVYRTYRHNAIVTCSPSTKADLERLGISGRNISVVRPGLSEAFLRFEPNGKKFDSPTIVCISRFRRYKGVHFAIRAMRYVLKSLENANLIIVGNGDDNDIRRELRLTGYESSVKIVNRSPHNWDEEKRSLLERAHLLIAPSVREGYGITVVEANACGTPAIGWKVPGLQDSIVDGETGILVPFGDVERLGNSIAHHLQNEDERQRMSASALKWARTHSWDKASEEFELNVESVLSPVD